MVRKHLISPLNDVKSIEMDRTRSISNSSRDNNLTKTGPIKPIVPFKQQQEQTKIHETDLNDEKQQRDNKIRKMLVFLITNFGMLLLVIGYIVIGALLFQTLEQHNEIQNCETGKGEEQDMILKYTNTLFNYIYFNTTTTSLQTENGTLVTSDVYNPVIDKYILEIRDFVLNNYASYRYYGQEDCEETSLWSMQSALLFTVTIVTTIGYGHVFPLTWQGQIVIICYATIGIPLFLMTTAKISVMLANIFAFLYKYIVLCPCNCVARHKKNQKKKKAQDSEKIVDTLDWDNALSVKSDTQIIDDDEDEYEDEDEEEEDTKVPLFVILTFFFGFLILGGHIFDRLEGWGLLTGSYFAYVSVSTMGFGDYVPGITELLNGQPSTAATNLLIAVFYIFIGISVLGMCFNLMNSTIVDKISTISEALKPSKNDKENETITDKA